MKKVLFLAAVLLTMPVFAFAAGHDALRCVGCHSMHDAKGDMIFAVKPNTEVNPATKRPIGGVTALCLGCHETTGHGGFGIKPVEPMMSHPFDVRPNPKVAVVPAQLLINGKLECTGCHEPHPSNPNAKYLRVDVSTKAGMESFCGVCHPGKGKASASSVKIYYGTETGGAPAPAPQRASKPEAKVK